MGVPQAFGVAPALPVAMVRRTQTPPPPCVGNLGHLLEGRSMHMTQNCKPPLTVCLPLIKAAGGVVLKKLPRKAQGDLVVLSCEQDLKGKNGKVRQARQQAPLCRRPPWSSARASVPLSLACRSQHSCDSRSLRRSWLCAASLARP